MLAVTEPTQKTRGLASAKTPSLKHRMTKITKNGSQAHRDEVDRQAQQIASEFFRGEITEAQARDLICTLAFSIDLDYLFIPLRRFLDNRFRDRVMNEANDALMDSIIVNPENQAKNKLDLERILHGDSLSGWSRMVVASLVRYRASDAEYRRLSKRNDLLLRSPSDGSPSVTDRMIVTEDADERATIAVEFLSTIHGGNELERGGVIARSVSWYLDIPYPWPQTSDIRHWVASEVHGPRDSSKAVADGLNNPSHPLYDLFAAWTESGKEAIVEADQRITFAWVKSLGVATPSPGRTVRDHLVQTMRSNSPDIPHRAVTRFCDALRTAMSGVQRTSRRNVNDMLVKSDEQIMVDREALREAGHHLATYVNPDAAKDGLVSQTVVQQIIRESIGIMLSYEYTRAASAENRRKMVS